MRSWFAGELDEGLTLLTDGHLADDRPIYLVSTAGLPNYGDEVLTRAWLDWLANAHPGTEVWLDCIEPGRAMHLFSDTHPRLRATNTLWQLAHQGGDPDPVQDEARIRRLVRGLGSPRIDAGLEMLRDVRSIHFLGGGYLNTVWPRNLGMLTAATEVKAMTGAGLYATGQGFAPQTDDSAPWLRRLLEDFDLVEVRDRASAELLGIDVGIDDAFLGLAGERPVYSPHSSPSFMLLLQGDLWEQGRRDRLLDVAISAVEAHAPDGRFGLVEGMPPDDGWLLAELRDRYDALEFYPFERIWKEGLPARAGQTWLTTRFHFHLLSAAAGAAGIALNPKPGYYDAKHGSLIELGSGWSFVGDDSPLQASVDAAFPVKARELAEKKQALAAALYPSARVTGARSLLMRMRGATMARRALIP